MNNWVPVDFTSVTVNTGSTPVTGTLAVWNKHAVQITVHHVGVSGTLTLRKWVSQDGSVWRDIDPEEPMVIAAGEQAQWLISHPNLARYARVTGVASASTIACQYEVVFGERS